MNNTEYLNQSDPFEPRYLLFLEDRYTAWAQLALLLSTNDRLCDGWRRHHAVIWPPRRHSLECYPASSHPTAFVWPVCSHKPYRRPARSRKPSRLAPRYRE